MCEQASPTVAIVMGSKFDHEVMKESAALLSTVRMPAGIPVGTTAIGKAGDRNAALPAVSVPALSDTRLREDFKAYRLKMRAEVEAADTEIRELSRV